MENNKGFSLFGDRRTNKESKPMKRKKVYTWFVVVFMVGMLAGLWINENKLGGFKDTKQKINNDLKECDILGKEASERGIVLKDKQPSNETIQEFIDFFDLSREYFLCIESVYQFEEVNEDDVEYE